VKAKLSFAFACGPSALPQTAFSLPSCGSGASFHTTTPIYPVACCHLNAMVASIDPSLHGLGIRIGVVGNLPFNFAGHVETGIG
jgi:hypothetical protein